MAKSLEERFDKRGKCLGDLILLWAWFRAMMVNTIIIVGCIGLIISIFIGSAIAVKRWLLTEIGGSILFLDSETWEAIFIIFVLMAMTTFFIAIAFFVQVWVRRRVEGPRLAALEVEVAKLRGKSPTDSPDVQT